MTMLTEIRAVLGDVLELGDKALHLDRSTALFGSMPEFDSMAVVSIILELEERFGIVIEGDEVDAQTFESVDSLCNFVDHKLAAVRGHPGDTMGSVTSSE